MYQEPITRACVRAYWVYVAITLSQANAREVTQTHTQQHIMQHRGNRILHASHTATHTATHTHHGAVPVLVDCCRKYSSTRMLPAPRNSSDDILSAIACAISAFKCGRLSINRCATLSMSDSRALDWFRGSRSGTLPRELLR